MERTTSKIRKVNHSLLQEKNKIQVINKSRLRDFRTAERIVKMAIPKLRHKFHDSIFEQKRVKWFEEQKVTLRSKFQCIQNQRKFKKIARSSSIQTLKRKKIQGSQSLRQFSRKNEERIRDMKRKMMEEKRKKKQEIKEKLENSRRKIQNFHQKKKEYLQFQKQEKILKERTKLRELSNKMDLLHYKKKKMINSKLSTSFNVEKMRKTVDRISKMNSSEFNIITTELDLCAEELNIYEVENFLHLVNNKYK